MGEPLKLKYSAPGPVAAEYIKDREHFIRVIMGPVGSGKSVASLFALVIQGMEQEPHPETKIRATRFAIVRNTNQQLKDTTLKTFMDWFGPLGSWKESAMTFTMKFNDVHMEFLFRALDGADDIRRLLSLELSAIYFNEFREINPEVFVAAQGRVARFPKVEEELGYKGTTFPCVIADTNPPDEDSWLHDLAEVDAPENFKIYKQPGAFEPGAENLRNLQPDYYKNQMAGASDEYINVHINAKYGRSRAGKPVHKIFTPALHISRENIRPIPERLVVIGMDFGLTPAAVCKQKDLWGRVHTLSEVYDMDMGLKRFLKQKLIPHINEFYSANDIVIVGDPSGEYRTGIDEETPLGYLRSKGFQVMPAPTNNIQPRIDATDGLFSVLLDDGRPQGMINPQCVWLRQALNGKYRYAKRKTGGFAPTPEKNEWSHIAEANQYGDMFFSLGLKARRTARQNIPQVNGFTVADTGLGY